MVPFAPTGGLFGEFGEGEKTRKRDCRILTMAQYNLNGIDYLYLSSPAGEHSHKGVDEAGESS